MKNRTIIGIICIVLALVVTFGVAPLVSRMDSNKVNIVRITRNVSQGHAVTENDVEIAEVGNYNLPSDVIRKKEDVVGKFAATDLKAGDYLFPSKLTDSSDNANDVFRTLKGDKQAISITIRSFAGGLSGKLQNGDIVQLVVYQNNADEAIVPPELTYLKVITTTTSDGIDRDELTVNEDGTYELPSTVTLLVNQKQAKLLVQYENSGRIHADLVYRGDEATAQKYLDAQEVYFKALSETETSGESSESNGNNGGDDVISRANDIINGRVPSYVSDKEESADE